MTAAYTATLPNPKTRLAQSFGGRRTCVRSEPIAAKAIIEKLRTLYPTKAQAHVAALCGVTTRAVEYWFSGRREPSADVLAALLRSEVGGDVLAAIMGDAKPKWWMRHRRMSDLAALRAAQEEQRRVIEALEMEIGRC